MLPKGFKALGLHCGIAKKKTKNDIALFCSELPADAAGMFTANLVSAAPVKVSQNHIKKAAAAIYAIIANSGCANACTGVRGMNDAESMCDMTARNIGADKHQVLVASTGVIGQFLPLRNIEAGIKRLAMRTQRGETDAIEAVKAIMTTDTFPKISSRTFPMNGKRITVWGCAKGAGMIHPDLKALHATMLSFILTDAAVQPRILQQVLSDAAEKSFNCVSVDGDTSTNDTLVILANGAAGADAINAGSKYLRVFSKAVNDVCLDLAKMLARDGEGATRLVEIEVRNASTASGAKKIAATVATSPLVKTAIFGNDANWGRIIAAAGRAGVKMDPGNTDVYIKNILVAHKGAAAKFSEAKAKKALQNKEVKVIIDLHQGKHKASYYTCDFTFDYVKINASYRS